MSVFGEEGEEEGQRRWTWSTKAANARNWIYTRGQLRLESFAACSMVLLLHAICRKPVELLLAGNFRGSGIEKVSDFGCCELSKRVVNRVLHKGRRQISARSSIVVFTRFDS